ncbi:MAG: UPF0175 family protein [Candidatus Helarchaeota archaeon]
MKNITIRVKEDMYREIEELTILDKSDKSTVVRQLLAKGLQERKKQRGLELYRRRKCTLWKATQIAGISLREMIDLAKSEGIFVNVSAKDIDEAWSSAFEES